MTIAVLIGSNLVLLAALIAMAHEWYKELMRAGQYKWQSKDMVRRYNSLVDQTNALGNREGIKTFLVKEEFIEDAVDPLRLQVFDESELDEARSQEDRYFDMEWSEDGEK
jgi:hypothetical protein